MEPTDQEVAECRRTFAEAFAAYGEDGLPEAVLDGEILAAYTLDRPAGSLVLPGRTTIQEVRRVVSVFNEWFAAEACIVYRNADGELVGEPLARCDELSEASTVSHVPIFYSRFESLVEVLKHREIVHDDEQNDALRGVLFGYDLEDVASYCECSVFVPEQGVTDGI